MYCQRVFIVVLQEVHCLLECLALDVYTKFHLGVSKLHAVPIVMYGLRLFIVVLQELRCLRKGNFPIPWSLWISISTHKFRFSTPYG